MKRLGLKHLLILSIVSLVGLSVSISNYVLFLQDEKVITHQIIEENRAYVRHKGEVIENFINEKVAGINRLAAHYKDKGVQGTPQEIIELTKLFAKALNTESVTINFEDGHGYWNQSNPVWTDNHFDGDVTTLDWYQEGRRSANVTITEPYLGLAKEFYWVMIIERIKDGVISTDLTLEFLNELVIDAKQRPGVAAVILDANTTVLATSSPVLDLGRKAISYPWFEDMVKKTISQDETIEDYKLDGQDKIFFAHRLRIGDRHWYFCIGVNKAIVFAELNKTINIAFITAAFSVIISMLCAYIILQILYRPIVELKKTILGLSSGDGALTQRLNVTTKDDLGQIAQGVNQFIDKIQSLIVTKETIPSLPLTKDEQELYKLGDTFTRRWKDAFAQYRSRVDKEEELREELKLDALTKLPTRSYFEILLGDAIKDVYAEHKELLLVTISLDNYETLAESLTYSQMQNAILELSGLIENRLPQDVTLSRTAQAEFSIILNRYVKDDDFKLMVRQLALELQSIDTETMVFNCKLGASHLRYTDEKPTVSGLFYQVNNALYSITNNINYAFFHKENDIEKEEKQSLIADLKSALLENDNGLQLYFQPQVNLRTKEVTGAEALIRWEHPEKGFLTPDRFVYVLNDDTQLNIRFGEWLIASALEKLSQRVDSLTISVNITALHLQREDFFERLRFIIKPYPHSVAQRLTIELTETDSISDHSQVEMSMRQCLELGVHFSLDDFGTGYSTLNQLRTFPATELKIDRSFVQNLENSDDDKKMISTMVMLAKSFDLNVVVEGVENNTQEMFLTELGELTIQGYYYSKPIPYAEFNQWLMDYQLNKK